MSRRIWKADRPACGKVDNNGDNPRRPLLERCKCGLKPTFRSWRDGEDVMVSEYACPCGERGGEVEDAYSDAPTARALWNAKRRKAAA